VVFLVENAAQAGGSNALLEGSNAIPTRNAAPKAADINILVNAPSPGSAVVVGAGAAGDGGNATSPAPTQGDSSRAADGDSNALAAGGINAGSDGSNAAAGGSNAGSGGSNAGAGGSNAGGSSGSSGFAGYPQSGGLLRPELAGLLVAIQEAHLYKDSKTAV
jgi:hypothetical protein